MLKKCLTSTRFSRLQLFSKRANNLVKYTRPRLTQQPINKLIISFSTTATTKENNFNQQHKQKQQQKHYQQRPWTRKAIYPILLTPVIGMTAYAIFRFWPTKDDEASRHRHSFIEADSHFDLPPLRAEFSWYQKDRYTIVVLLESFFRSVYLTIVFSPAVLLSPLLLTTRTTSWWWSVVLQSMAAAGPCFLKLGQWAATRPDLFSEATCEQLSALHDNCPEHSFAETKRIILESFGYPIELIFAEFDEVPVASGTIAQVYRARTFDGQEVAVKVSHPHIVRKVEADLRLLHGFASMIQLLPRMKYMAFKESIEQFALTMIAQLDFRYEARNMRRFARNFEHDDSVNFAMPISPDLISNNVLVETYQQGIPLKKFLRSDDLSENHDLRGKIAKIGIDAYLRMLLIHNFVHADLHPGNILVQLEDTEAGTKLNITLLDCGLVTELSDEDSNNFVELFVTLVEGDARRGAELMIDRARMVDKRISSGVQPKPTRTPLPHRDVKGKQQRVDDDIGGHVDETEAQRLAWREAFIDDVSKALSLEYENISDIQVSRVMRELFSAARHYGVQIEPNFATLVVGTAVLEGVGRQLNPRLSLLEAALPVLLRRHALLMRERVSHWLPDDCSYQ